MKESFTYYIKKKILCRNSMLNFPMFVAYLFCHLPTLAFPKTSGTETMSPSFPRNEYCMTKNKHLAAQWPVLSRRYYGSGKLLA